MPQGFVGNASYKYLSAISEAMDAANSVHLFPPSHARDTGNRTDLPHHPDEAMSGSYNTKTSNQDNIVVNVAVYHEILEHIRVNNNKIAEEIHILCCRIEKMCSTIYIVPDTLPKYLDIVNRMKTMLYEFQTLPDESRVYFDEFLGDIIEHDANIYF
ncbi:MAG: hypothetical protein LBC96_06115 [Lachnospiraceae bacterium]|jgi:hypothetical protein|nr:hypothetical protein [Lachnospiraceae bacterium]